MLSKFGHVLVQNPISNLDCFLGLWDTASLNMRDFVKLDVFGKTAEIIPKGLIHATGPKTMVYSPDQMRHFMSATRCLYLKG